MKTRKAIVALLIIGMIQIIFVSCKTDTASGTTKDYLWPAYLNNMSNISAERMAEIINEDLGSDFYTDYTINDDETLTISCTDAQRASWVNNADSIIERTIERGGNIGITIEVNDERNAFSVEVFPEKTTPQDFLGYFVGVTVQCFTYQIFSDITWEDCGVSFTVINAETGLKVKEGTLPQDSFTIESNEWG